MRISRSTAVSFKLDPPSHWTIHLVRECNGTLEIALAHGDNTPKQGITLSAEEADALLSTLELADAPE